MKIDFAKLLRIAIQVAAAAPVLVAALKPVVAAVKPKASGPKVSGS